MIQCDWNRYCLYSLRVQFMSKHVPFIQVCSWKCQLHVDFQKNLLNSSILAKLRNVGRRISPHFFAFFFVFLSTVLAKPSKPKLRLDGFAETFRKAGVCLSQKVELWSTKADLSKSKACFMPSSKKWRWHKERDSFHGTNYKESEISWR